jgi:N4-gp56 family major capsid protein
MQRWAVSADGGFLAHPDLSQKLRYVAQPLMKLRQFVRAEPGFGRKKGDTLLFDRVSNVTIAGRRISELERMPESGVTISQGSLTVDEFGNSIAWTGRLEDLSEFDPENIWLRTLRDDAARTLDRHVAAEFRTTPVKAIPTGAAATTFREDGTTVAATTSVTAAHVKDIVDEMKARWLVPFYDGENYMAVVSVKFGRRLKDDAAFDAAARYGDPERLFSGEIGRYYGVRFIEETHVLSNTLGTTTHQGEAIFFGADPVVEGIVVPLEMRAKIPTDYGRDKGLAWYFLGGWRITWPTAGAGEVKIVHVTSS